MTTPPPLLGGRYELIAPLGSGGMADVHRARDRVLHRDVAIKLLRASSDVDRERFASEARILALLGHEAIVAVYDAGVDHEQPWLALELVVGTTLADVLASGHVAERELARLASQVAAGLAHAHDRGVVHRDVKPSNVLVSQDGRTRLTDFGIARLIDSGSQLTITGHAIGTAAYLAPEQVRGEPVTGATDVYALGLVLLEALTGRRSFDGTPVEAALARLHHGPLIPTSLPAGWPGLLASMTASDPAERPPATAVAERLEELAVRAPVSLGSDPTSHVPAAAAAVVPRTPAPPVPSALPVLIGPPADRRRWQPLAAVAAAVGLVLVLVVSALLMGAQEPTVASSPGAGTTTPTGTTSARPGASRTPRPTPAAPEVTPTASGAVDLQPSPQRPGASRPHGAGGTKAQHPGKGKPNHAKGKGKGKSKGKGKGR